NIPTAQATIARLEDELTTLTEQLKAIPVVEQDTNALAWEVWYNLFRLVWAIRSGVTGCKVRVEVADNKAFKNAKVLEGIPSDKGIRPFLRHVSHIAVHTRKVKGKNGPGGTRYKFIKGELVFVGGNTGNLNPHLHPGEPL